MRIVNITDRISYIGVNDRRTSLFENNWPLPYGVSYNSYIIRDEKNVLIDTVELGSDGEFIDKIKAVLKGGKLDYIVVNHMEPDHSSMLRSVLDIYPEAKVIGNIQTVKLLKEFYDTPDERIKTIKDGEEINTGKSSLKFVLTPWVHWPETMVTYDAADQVVFTCDAFGGFGTLDGGIFDGDYNFEEKFLSEMRRYYSNIVAKYSGMVTKAIAKLDGVPIKVIAPSHGLVWRDNPLKVIGLYKDWAEFKSEKGVVIAYASMYGNTAALADMIGSKLTDHGVKNIITHDVSKTSVSFILSDIQRYKGVVLGTCAYNGVMHPMMAHLCNELKITAQKNKVYGIFGTSAWNGAGAKDLKKFAEENKWEVVNPSAEAFGCPSPEKVEEAADAMTQSLAAALEE